MNPQVEVKTETSPTKKWVQFDEESNKDTKQLNGSRLETESTAAVIPTESVEITVDRSLNRSSVEHDHVVDVDLHEPTNGSAPSTGVVRQGFSNGDIIVTLLPVNTNFPWITPAQFRPELVPEELMAQGLTLTVEDYVQIMELLTNDYRFTMYNICYKRVLVVWIFSAFAVLLGLLFSGLTGLILFGLGVLWLIFNAAAIFFCMWIKIKLSHNLERCMAKVNKHLIRHKIILGLDDRGKISCHKVNLCFIYFDVTDCVKKLQELIEKEEAAGRVVNREESHEDKKKRQQFKNRMDIEDSDYIIQGSQTTRVSRKQAKGEQLLLRYLQRWCKDYLRRRLDWTLDEDLGNPSCPLHLSTALCPCQHIFLHLASKPPKDPRVFCPCWSDWLRERGVG
ncbi:transmembrane protein 268 isoform X1 [Cimex lectularius]|uniref:Transmembrane protein 268 n=1 Tax=Cimex lectularius TaxID=79782 RepID=A0A8I6RXP2_CIMLE|nr:transmembrane protein 268 isoform X1 [Cimex lectularius]